jgi:hypothetical protein
LRHSAVDHYEKKVIYAVDRVDRCEMEAGLMVQSGPRKQEAEAKALEARKYLTDARLDLRCLSDAECPGIQGTGYNVFLQTVRPPSMKQRLVYIKLTVAMRAKYRADAALVHTKHSIYKLNYNSSLNVMGESARLQIAKMENEKAAQHEAKVKADAVRKEAEDVLVLRPGHTLSSLWPQALGAMGMVGAVLSGNTSWKPILVEADPSSYRFDDSVEDEEEAVEGSTLKRLLEQRIEDIIVGHDYSDDLKKAVSNF